MAVIAGSFLHAKSLNMPISSAEIEEFYKVLYFGAGKNHAELAIDRAYRDFNRTLRNFSSHRNKDLIKDIWRKKLKRILSDLCQRRFTSQEAYDRWHQKQTEALSTAAKKPLTIGQSQKWINMSIKYAYVLGPKRFPGIKANYRYYHIPIDNIIQKLLKEKAIDKLTSRWSRIATYEEYIQYQQKIREAFPRQIPFEVEFRCFNRPDAE